VEEESLEEGGGEVGEEEEAEGEGLEEFGGKEPDLNLHLVHSARMPSSSSKPVVRNRSGAELLHFGHRIRSMLARVA